MSFISLSKPGDPTLVMLHGTGGNEAEMAGLAPRLLARAGYLSLRGKEPEHGANRWFRRLAEGVFDEENLVMRSNELADHLEATLPDVRRVAVGISNGANIAAAIALLRPEALHGAVLIAPMVPLSPASLPVLTGVPILMICGERDSMVPRANAQALATMFETAGADLTLHWHPGGHGVSMTEIQVAASWLANHF